MSLNIKYQYTHFIYPFTVESDKYYSFLRKIIKDNKNWKLNIDRKESNFESYDFFLPYMKKFLFPTLFWNEKDIKEYKRKSDVKKAIHLENMSCLTFNYTLDAMKVGSISKERYGSIDFDIIDIKLIVFSTGVCFIDFKTEVHSNSEFIDFDKVLDFNSIFRDITSNTDEHIRAKCINCKDDIKTFIDKIVSGYASNEIEKQYYDKLFTYSYACVDKESWKDRNDLDKILNDFIRFQYVEKGDNKVLFNSYDKRINNNIYSRWENSLFGFSRESGVVMCTEVDKYNYTKLPDSFEKKYFYILILALYQRISLINFSHKLLKSDKTQIHSLQTKFTKFTHFSWFSQISNSEHGMELWKKWKKTFELDELFEEVHKEYMEYYEFLSNIKQERINFILILIYVIAAIFSAMTVMSNFMDISKLMSPITMVVLLTIMIISYPIFLIFSWFKHKSEGD